jgi:hypothetical protein
MADLVETLARKLASREAIAAERGAKADAERWRQRIEAEPEKRVMFEGLQQMAERLAIRALEPARAKARGTLLFLADNITPRMVEAAREQATHRASSAIPEYTMRIILAAAIRAEAGE